MYLPMHQSLRYKHSGTKTARQIPSALAQALLLFLMLIRMSLSDVAADTLTELDPEQQERITRLCAPVQFDQGAGAYRQCVLDQVSIAVQIQRPETTTLLALSLDEQFAIQQACESKGADLSTNDSSCTQQQITQLEQEPAPELTALTKDEQYFITTQCLDTYSAVAARDYRVCVNNAVSSLDALPAADFSQQPAGTRSSIELECSNASTNVSDYRSCLVTSLGVAPTNSSMADTASADTTSANQSNVATESIQSVEPVQQAESVESALSSEPEAKISADDSQLAQVDDKQRATQEKPANLASSTHTLNPGLEPEDNTDKTLQLKLVAIVSAISIPLMLLGVRFARKPDKFERQTAAAHSAPSYEKVHSSPQPSPASSDVQPLSSTRRQDNSSPSLSDTAAIEAQMNETYLQPVSNGTQQKSSTGNRKHAQEDLSTDSRTDQTAKPENPADRGRFELWLTHWPVQRQQEHAIELLVYWVAYADNRYDPALKKTIFLMNDPDANSLIKRWVMKNDVTAFADAIKHLQRNTDLAQRKQVIDLLMALLVNENALTPNQNVLLRFLADAFGIGRDELDSQFLQAFGQPMPAMPRPDKSIWWTSLNAEQKLRWDVHAIARQPEQVRHRIVLGQPLEGELNLQSIDKSYAMAMMRCHDKRASKLGEREQMLLQTQRQKIIAAHSALLEPVE